MSFSDDFLRRSQQRCNLALSQLLSTQSSFYAEGGTPALARLKTAAAYSIENGGKRIRPALVYATAAALRPGAATVLDADLDLIAAAIECVHSYSLVHDDLPAMDDDDLRRGKPTCHIAFDEATAILVGDGLQALAFEALSQCQSIPAATLLQLVRQLAQAAGNFGMVGGQMIDLASEGQALTLAQLELLHSLKTGALIRASVQMAATACQASAQEIHWLDDYARAIGLAFQVQDDILDIESDTQTLGKPQGADQALVKATYPALLGLPQAKQKATDLIAQAQHALQQLPGDCQHLTQLADFIVQRNH